MGGKILISLSICVKESGRVRGRSVSHRDRWLSESVTCDRGGGEVGHWVVHTL
jgi:hypothetical protein